MRLPPSIHWALLATALPALVGAGLHAGWLLDPRGLHPISAFGASHVWGLDQLARNLLAGHPLEVWTDRLGFPRGGAAPTLGLAPALLALPVRPLLGPLGAYAFALHASLGLSGLFAWLWLRRLGAAAAPAAAGALLFAFSPGVLNNLALGNIDKLALWLYPAWLWATHRAVEERRGLAWLPLVGLFAFLAPMSEPYLGLFLPLVGVPLIVLAAGRRPAGARLRAALGAGLALALTAASMAPARDYYGQYRAGPQGAAVFRPAAVRTADGGDGWTRPWAGLDDLLRPTVPVPEDPERAFHVFYIGLVALLAALGFGLLPGVRRRAEGLLLAAIGLLLLLGPYTVLPEAWHLPGPQRYLLPDTLLERAGYPTAVGGQYYRALPLLSLGLGALLAMGLSARLEGAAGARRGRWVAVASLLIPALALADALRATPGAWPRPLRPVPCRSVLASIAAAGGEGAVLNLNMRASQARNGEAMMLATLHGRPIQTLPLMTMGAPIDAAYGFLSPLAQSGSTEAALRWLRGQGFRFLLDAPLGEPPLDLLRPAALVEALGEATWREGDCRAWDLDRAAGGR